MNMGKNNVVWYVIMNVKEIIIKIKNITGKDWDIIKININALHDKIISLIQENDKLKKRLKKYEGIKI